VRQILRESKRNQLLDETCEIIWNVLKQDYLKAPQTTNEWKDIADLFEKRWNFHHCLAQLIENI